MQAPQILPAELNDPSDKEAPLREDIRLLGRVLGDTIRAQEGEAVFDLVETIRQTAIRFHRKDATARARLDTILKGLSRDQSTLIIRAFSYFSHLANIAEDQHHIRRARSHAIAGSAPREGAVVLALDRVRKAGIARAEVEGFFADAFVCPVLTAHPTEVQRKSTLDPERDVAKLLADRDRPARMPDERAETDEALRRTVLTLWQTSLLRRHRLKVIDEIANRLSYYDYTFLAELPRLYDRFENALAAADPVWNGVEMPSFFRMGSWIGGDRDGNPSRRRRCARPCACKASGRSASISRSCTRSAPSCRSTVALSTYPTR